jgi:hypothetical protein
MRIYLDIGCGTRFSGFYFTVSGFGFWLKKTGRRFLSGRLFIG